VLSSELRVGVQPPAGHTPLIEAPPAPPSPSPVSPPGGATPRPATQGAGAAQAAEATASRGASEVLTETFGKRLPGNPLERSQQVLQQITEGTYKPPADLTTGHLDYYEQVAKDAIDAGKDTTGIQQVRLQIVQALRELIK